MFGVDSISSQAAFVVIGAWVGLCGLQQGADFSRESSSGGGPGTDLGSPMEKVARGLLRGKLVQPQYWDPGQCDQLELVDQLHVSQTTIM